MSTPEPVTELPPLDDPPQDGYWAPEVNEINPTPEELAAGNLLGNTIRIEDDHDGGEQ